MPTKLTNAAASAACDSLFGRINAGAGPGTVKLYTGLQPVHADDGIGGATLLGTFTLNDPAFGAATNGVAVLDVTPPLSTTGVANGEAGWFRCADSNGVTVFDGGVGTSGTQLNLNTTAITVGLTIEITSGTFAMPIE